MRVYFSVPTPSLTYKSIGKITGPAPAVPDVFELGRINVPCSPNNRIQKIEVLLKCTPEQNISILHLLKVIEETVFLFLSYESNNNIQSQIAYVNNLTTSLHPLPLLKQKCLCTRTICCVCHMFSEKPDVLSETAGAALSPKGDCSTCFLIKE